MKQSVFIQGPLPGMNDFIGKGQRWAYNQAKEKWTFDIGWAIKQQKLKPMKRVFITWTWQEPNEKRDPDNFVGIGKKFILDALVSMEILPNDGWKQIAGWDDRWVVVPSAPGVLVELEEA